MEILKKIGKIILTLVIAIVSVILSITVMLILTDIILINDDFLFYEHGQITGQILFFLFMIPAIFLSVFVMQKLKVASRRQIENNEELIWFWNRLGLFKIPVIIVWCIAVYFCFCNVTIVTESEIIIKTPFNPTGAVYQYDDVDEIEVGFGDKFISCSEYEEEGNFYYIIKIDNKEVVFYQPTVNDNIERYGETAYLELLEFDSKLKLFNVKKTSNGNGAEKSGYDDETLKILLLIINN